MLGMKQYSLAVLLGQEWNQRKVSLLEQKAIVPLRQLKAVAQALNVSEKSLLEFDEEAANDMLDYLSSERTESGWVNLSPPKLQFHPLEKIIDLYEALIKAEQEKNRLLNKIVTIYEEYHPKPNVLTEESPPYWLSPDPVTGKPRYRMQYSMLNVME